MFGLSLEWIQKLYPGGGGEVPVIGNSLDEDDNGLVLNSLDEDDHQKQWAFGTLPIKNDMTTIPYNSSACKFD